MWRCQWNVMVWKNWVWLLQKMMVPSRLSFPQTKGIALQKSLVDQFSFMSQGSTRYQKLWRAKSKTATPFPLLLFSGHHAPQEQVARVGQRLVLPKLWIFLSLQSGVWHQVATMFLSSLSLEYLDHYVFKRLQVICSHFIEKNRPFLWSCLLLHMIIDVISYVVWKIMPHIVVVCYVVSHSLWGKLVSQLMLPCCSS